MKICAWHFNKKQLKILVCGENSLRLLCTQKQKKPIK